MSPPVDHVEPSLMLPDRADVVVIGGGIIGCSAAYFLAKQGVSVALCEKGRIAGEQSSRNWGFCRQQGRDPAEIPLIMESLAIWRRLEKEIGERVGFYQRGVLYAEDDEKEIAKWDGWLEHAKLYQIDTRLLSSRELDDLMPGSTRKWKAGLWTPSDGRAEPSMAAPAIARAAKALGATLHSDCTVRGLETETGRVSGVVTERGVIRTNAVLCAAGAWSSLFCRRHGIVLPQLKLKSSVLRTSPGPAVFEGGLSTPDFSLRRRSDGGYSVASGGSIFSIVPDAIRWMQTFWPAFLMERKSIKLRIGASFFEELSTPGDWPLDQPTPFEKNRTWDPQPDGKALAQAFKAMTAAYPALSELKVEQTWAGMIDATPDAVPAIGEVEALPGFFLATGFSGHGFGIGPGAGRLSAELVSGAATCVDPTPFSYRRFIDGRRLAPKTGL
jgi:glycine/D-amino acid oxidase-like deaminating enzyme